MQSSSLPSITLLQFGVDDCKLYVLSGGVFVITCGVETNTTHMRELIGKIVASLRL